MRWALAPCPLSVGWRSAWDHGLHTQVEDAFHHISGYRVNHPAAGVLQVFYIAIGHIGGQGYASLTLGFLDGSDLAAGVPGIELVEPVFDARKIVVHTVRVNGVVVVVDGDERTPFCGKVKLV